MQTNMKYMGLSMKPTLVTFIPIIIIFGWMHAHLAYNPILPNQDFTVSAEFKSSEGNIELSVPEGLIIISDSTQTIIVRDTVIQDQPALDFEQELGRGAEAAFKDIAEFMEDEGDSTQALVRLARGTPIGVFFLEPVTEEQN